MSSAERLTLWIEQMGEAAGNARAGGDDGRAGRDEAEPRTSSAPVSRRKCRNASTL